MARTVQFAPSILSADFGCLAAEIADVAAAGASFIHVDVMDGRFVPNITLGPVVLQGVRRATTLPLDVHLMIVEPERYIEDFARAGADIITIHAEATPHVERALAEIRRLGKKAGVALNPQTPESVLEYVLHVTDLVLVMSVNPGFGGQRFLPSVLPKIRRIAQMIEQSGRDIRLEVDGGVALDTVGQIAEAGADLLVAGAAVFGQPDRGQALRALATAAVAGPR